jgi:hypothetical protein
VKAKCIRLHAGYNVGKGYLPALSSYFSHQQQLSLTNYYSLSPTKDVTILSKFRCIYTQDAIRNHILAMCANQYGEAGAKHGKARRVFDTRHTCHRIDRLGLMALLSVFALEHGKCIAKCTFRLLDPHGKM